MTFYQDKEDKNQWHHVQWAKLGKPLSRKRYRWMNYPVQYILTVKSYVQPRSCTFSCIRLCVHVFRMHSHFTLKFMNTSIVLNVRFLYTCIRDRMQAWTYWKLCWHTPMAVAYRELSRERPNSPYERKRDERFFLREILRNKLKRWEIFYSNLVSFRCSFFQRNVNAT